VIADARAFNASSQLMASPVSIVGTMEPRLTPSLILAVCCFRSGDRKWKNKHSRRKEEEIFAKIRIRSSNGFESSYNFQEKI